jgi:hypothetical protein
MEVVGLVLSYLVDFVITRKVLRLDSSCSLSRGSLHACLVAFVVARRSLGSSCCVRCREEVVVLFIVIVKRCCHPLRLDVAVVIVLLLLLSSLHFSGLSFKKNAI